jgi:hypothetical protein
MRLPALSWDELAAAEIQNIRRHYTPEKLALLRDAFVASRDPNRNQMSQVLKLVLRRTVDALRQIRHLTQDPCLSGTAVIWIHNLFDWFNGSAGHVSEGTCATPG